VDEDGRPVAAVARADLAEHVVCGAGSRGDTRSVRRGGGGGQVVLGQRLGQGGGEAALSSGRRGGPWNGLHVMGHALLDELG